ncbi:alkaline phosphatase [Halochromatium roseum]|uniref:alkaline phosphatase n=1 Tax=Halochromatium roseum TaxID=391920 RepID=UPI0019128939|nr:alkaline phosphatase [Halochromatium roseum]
MLSNPRAIRRTICASTITCQLLFASSTFATPVKNVIVLIPDGNHTSIQTVARWYVGQPLALDEMGAGTMSTDMANSVITGSAAAGTAQSTSYKTTVRFLGIGPRPDDALSTYQLPEGIPVLGEEAGWNWLAYRPLATVLEGAQQVGKATGLVSTSRITHATPASYAVHVDDRGKDNEIMEQLVYQGLDVAFGGGGRHLLPESEGGHRTDGENLVEVLEQRGYQLPTTAAALAGLTSGRAWGMFASSHMMPDLDRRYRLSQGEQVTEPSLAEMTSKAIELLSQDPDGFFLVVEASQVDWGGHATDPAYMLHDFLAFDDAVRVALEFAKQDGETLLLGAPDHNTGAMTIGNWSTSSAYTDISVEQLLDPLRGMKVTSGYLADQLPDEPDAAAIKATVTEYWGIALSDEDVAWIQSEAESVGYAYAIAKVVSANHTVFGWTTHGHTGEDVTLWSYGPMAPIGQIDNTDLGRAVANAFALNLDLGDPQGLNQSLFIDAEEAFPGRTRTDLSDPENPVLEIANWRLPANKDEMLSPQQRICQFEGLTVYAPEANNGFGRWFIPRAAIEVGNNPSLQSRACR